MNILPFLARSFKMDKLERHVCWCFNWNLSCFSEKLKTSTTTESGQNPDKLWPGMLTYSYACACYNVDHCSCELKSLKKVEMYYYQATMIFKYHRHYLSQKTRSEGMEKKCNLNWTYEDPKWTQTKRHKVALIASNNNKAMFGNMQTQKF